MGLYVVAIVGGIFLLIIVLGVRDARRRGDLPKYDGRERILDPRRQDIYEPELKSPNQSLDERKVAFSTNTVAVRAKAKTKKGTRGPHIASSTQEFIQRYKEIGEELSTWRKVSWGIFFGAALTFVAVFTRLGDIPDLHEPVYRFVLILGLILVGINFFRKRKAYKVFDASWDQYLDALPKDDRRAAREELFHSNISP